MVAPAFAVNVTRRSIIAVNDRLRALLGREGDDLAGQLCEAICWGPRDRACLEATNCPVAAAFATAETETASISLIADSGELVPATVTGVIVGDGVAFIASGTARRSGDATAAAHPLVRVRTLGGFSVVDAAGAELTPRRARTLSLFKLLLTKQGAALTEAETCQAFWPDASRERALNGLQVLVHDLRRMLEPDLADGRRSRFILRRSESYLIAPDAPIEIDMQSFLRSAAAAHADAAAGKSASAVRHARAALETYTGDLFESDTEAAWYATQRRRLRETHVDVMLLLAKLLAGSDRHAAIEQCRRAASADVLREDAHRLLIVLLARESGRVVASQYFVEMFAAFKARSGLAPSRETAELVERVMKADDLEAIERELMSSIGGPSEATAHTAG